MARSLHDSYKIFRVCALYYIILPNLVGLARQIAKQSYKQFISLGAFPVKFSSD